MAMNAFNSLLGFSCTCHNITGYAIFLLLLLCDCEGFLPLLWQANTTSTHTMDYSYHGLFVSLLNYLYHVAQVMITNDQFYLHKLRTCSYICSQVQFLPCDAHNAKHFIAIECFHCIHNVVYIRELQAS